MLLSNLILVLSIIFLPASGSLFKEGSTCIVTPISASPQALVRRSIDTVPSTRRDVDPDQSTGLWDVIDPYKSPAPGTPGALTHFPHPEPGRAHFHARRGLSPFEREVEPLTTRQTPAPVDDTPQILEAFKQCGQDGTIIFREGTYHIRQVMDTTDLRNCSIEIHGTWVWSADNIPYWRQRSFSVTYANRQTAWRLGGRDVSLRGFGKALFDGNGQVWIDLARGQANMDGRPISLTIWKGTNVLIDGIRWQMAQFWHTFVAHSQNVTMTNLEMHTYSKSSQSSVNTDGTNTWNSRDIYIANWTVTSGDVSVAVSGPVYLTLSLPLSVRLMGSPVGLYCC